MGRNTRIEFIVAAILVSMSIAAGSALAGGSLDRPRDPVVIEGSDLPGLQGLPVNDISAFRYDTGWSQIPVQVDERKYVDFGAVYDTTDFGVGTVTYVDSLTYTGPDMDPAFDGDDELVFMAFDAGDRAPAGAGLPSGVVSDGPTLEMEIEDPLDGGVGYVYLFQSDGSLLPGAGEDYVAYSFNPEGGPYIPNYNRYGANPESSVVYSDNYRTFFWEMWIRDELNIYAGGSSGADILDRHRNQFAPGDCGRTEDTFSAGEGVFFANIDGPVRAIRSYMGANSGPFTQRLHLFYGQRHDVTTFLRVHEIKGIMDLYDYSPDAVGMSYYNNLNTGGVTVDGQGDTVSLGELTWEMVTGPQGTLVVSHSLETNIDPFAYTSYYSDNDDPSETQCTGDEFEYAESGDHVNQTIPDTNPPSPRYLNTTRIVHYESPSQAVGLAEERHDQAMTPFALTVYQYAPDDPLPALSTPGALALLTLILVLGILMLRRSSERGRVVGRFEPR